MKIANRFGTTLIMDERRRVKISKYLSKHLRHQPKRLGLTLQAGGWVEVATLLAACKAHGFSVSPSELDEVVFGGDKQRFSFDEARKRIRANHGHSVAVDLGYEPTIPPRVLYHGTAEKSVASILEQGLKPLGRAKVHLSLDVETAVSVGRRHGKAVVLEIDTGPMRKAGHAFYFAASGVWLTDAVPPHFLRLSEGPQTSNMQG